jgi:hypothetical protein
MSQELINLSPDLKRLVDEGYSLELRNGFVLIHDIPYINTLKTHQSGTLVCPLTLSGNKTARPNDHVMRFIGDHPCDVDGNEITSIKHSSATENLGEGITVNHMFSNKPPDGFDNYYDKFLNYICIIIAPVLQIDPLATAQMNKPVIETTDSVFYYRDSSTSRANIGSAVEKLSGQKVGIVGLGGTGSYVLDLVSKTPVSEIHLFDGDKFYSHNAFRAPGAASIEELENVEYKTDRFANIYAKMRKGIVSHPINLSYDALGCLLALDFVFLCIDTGEDKKNIIQALVISATPFIDTGIGLEINAEKLFGAARITAVLMPNKEGWKDRISFGETRDELYSSNIQIAEINSLCAVLAVIKWKKFYGVYREDQVNDFITFDIGMGDIINES